MREGLLYVEKAGASEGAMGWYWVWAITSLIGAGLAYGGGLAVDTPFVGYGDGGKSKHTDLQKHFDILFLSYNLTYKPTQCVEF